MLTELCEYLKNWFDEDMPKRITSFTISGGKLQDVDDMLSEGQYYRIVNSKFNDGVYKYGDADLEDETFDGAVWAMRVPKRMITLAKDIEAWQKQYGDVSGQNMSPYQSESFGGYSYSKGGGSSDDAYGSDSWQGKFKSRLDRWRKV